MSGFHVIHKKRATTSNNAILPKPIRRCKLRRPKNI